MTFEFFILFHPAYQVVGGQSRKAMLMIKWRKGTKGHFSPLTLHYRKLLKKHL